MIVRYFAVLLVLIGGVASYAVAGEVELRFVAADVKERPPVSQLVDFRRSPDGGLIAVQWISGVKLGERILFPVSNRKASAPGSADLESLAEKRGAAAADDTAELLEEANEQGRKREKLPPPPVDVVDPQYVGQTLSDGFKVGPQRARPSVAVVEVKTPATITPGAQQVSPTAKRVDLPCYRVSITARRGDESLAAFEPKLTWQGRDLLADCLFEHSPDLPLGDFDPATAPTGFEDRLAASIGGERQFRQLNIYLPALGKGELPYQLNGQAFTLAADGVHVTAETGRSARANAPSLRAVGKFGLELTLPAAESREVFALPVLSELEPEWKLVRDGKPVDLAGQTIEVSPTVESLNLTLRSPAGEEHVLRTALAAPVDQRRAWHTYVLLSPGGITGAPRARTIAVRPADDSRKGTLRVRLSESGSLKVLSAMLTSWEAKLAGKPTSAQQSPEEFTIALERTSVGDFTAATEKTPAGLYDMRLDVDGGATPAIPVVIAHARTRGSVTLATYHNRCDYLRGEQVHVAAIVRARDEFKKAVAEVVLRHELGEERSIGEIELDCAAGATSSQFITLTSGDLRLGRYVLSIRTPDAIGYSLPLTIYAERPRTTFALYRWMVGSFSGPVRVGGEVIANLLFDQSPTRFVSPQEMAQFTDQGTLAAQLAPTLAADPFYPAVEKTVTYDRDTELEMAVAMRLGLRYGPSYGWGLNSQEANWNPKHTLPDDLARARRLCTQVTQRFRDFGNFAGLHLNWYPTIGGYWEQHPPTDGHAARRGEALTAEINEVREAARKQDPKISELELAMRGAKHRVGALPRAYDSWLTRARQMPAGMFDRHDAAAGAIVDQPGLSPTRPAYTSFLPIGWFKHDQYYPSVYHSALPLAGVHAYTDYGFSPFQAQWGIDYWAASVRDKPVWATTMSNGRDVMLGQALLAVARGADGIDVNGDDETAARVVANFLTSYGPWFRRLTPESDVAIITSLREQLAHGERVGQWMGYNGGDYFDLYTKLWYARRPPAMLLEEEVTPERLRQFKGVFLVKQTELLPAPALDALRQYVKQGGHVFKDRATAAEYPGDVYDLTAADNSEPNWPLEHYQATRDRMFVATQASYETAATSLAKLLERLGPLRVTTPDHHTLAATMAGTNIAVAMAVNDTHPWPGIEHPWNFWSATVMAAEAELSFDRQYAVYDLLAGGRELPLERRGERFVLPISFDRAGGRALALLPTPLAKIVLRTCPSTVGGVIPLEVQVIDRGGNVLSDPVPLELTMIDDRGSIVETIYRALSPGERCELTIPASSPAGRWTVRARELFSGLAAEMAIEKTARPQAKLIADRVLIPRPDDLQAFFHADDDAGRDRYLLLVDGPQVERFGDELLMLARNATERLKEQGIEVDVQVVDPLSIVEVPERWRLTQRDRQYMDEAREGTRIVVAQSLATRYHRGEKQRDQPDWLHPWSGYGEPGARHRVFRKVILLGEPGTNRFLEDLHRTIGMRASASFPAPGSALAQVVFDAFTPEHHALSIQSHDLAGMRQCLDGVLRMIERDDVAAGKSEPASTKLETTESTKRTQLPNPLNESFGAPVAPLAFLPDGGVLASAGTQASNYFVFDAQGQLQRKWLGNYSVQLSADQQVTWLRNWWGAPGYLDKIIRGDGAAEPQWMMDAPGYSGSFDGWRYPGTQSLVDPLGEDLFVSGHHQVSRISPTGKVVWRYDDLTTSNDVTSFRFARDMMLHAVSPDGKYLLVVAFGIEPYARFVSRFVRPAVMLFDARSGKLLWEKSDILADHTACDITAQGILVGDATPGRKRLVLYDLTGKEQWSIGLSAGSSRAALSAGGEWLVVQGETPRGANHQIVGEPGNLSTIQLADQSVRELSPGARILDWRLLAAEGRVLVTTADGRLTSFAMDGRADWESSLGGPCQMLVSTDGRQIVVGTATGKLRWIDPKGKVLREADLMEHHIVRNAKQYVRDYTRSPRETPVLSPYPAKPAPIYERAAKSVKFSKNLLDRAAALESTANQPLTGEASSNIDLVEGETYLLSLLARSPGGLAASTAEQVVVELKIDGESESTYRAELPISAAWQERTAVWRASRTGAARMAVRVKSSADAVKGAELARIGVFRVRYPSANILADRVPLVPRDPAAIGGAQTDGLLGSTGRALPPAIRYFMPNDVDLTAAARGAPPFKPTLEFTVPLDGRLAGQETSWLGKPVSGSSHAQLQLTFKQPVRINTVAVHEDCASASRYTDTYAVLAREVASGTWRQIGHVAKNCSPYNLFTCETIETDAITYLWIKSADGHVRVAEIEAYGPADELLPAEE